MNFEEIATMELVSYERTKADAVEIKREYEAANPGVRCIVVGNGRRARKGTYDKPWQVRIVPKKAAAK